MIKRKMLVVLAITIFVSIPAFAAGEGCKTGRFAGSYTLTHPDVDIFGDGTEVHTYVFQLTLHADGNANMNWTGFNDYFTNLGTGSPWIGSWVCRKDGKLVVNMITATYIPSTPSGNAPIPDIALFRHTRNTQLFSIVDINTIRREQSRNRRYNVLEDPTDPNGGTLGLMNSGVFMYNRLVASDADLLVP